jgi:hypothetical protein
MLSITDDDEMLECFLNFPSVNHAHPFVLDFGTIRHGQQQDQVLLAHIQCEPQKFANMLMANNVSLIVYIVEQYQVCNWITLFDSITKHSITWAYGAPWIVFICNFIIHNFGLDPSTSSKLVLVMDIFHHEIYKSFLGKKSPLTSLDLGLLQSMGSSSLFEP